MIAVGIDIGKRMHEACFLAADGRPLGRSLRFANSSEGVDAAGRLQIPREFLERLSIRERAKILLGEDRVEVMPEHTNGHEEGS